MVLFSSAAFIWLAPEKNSKKRNGILLKNSKKWCSSVFFCFFSLARPRKEFKEMVLFSSAAFLWLAPEKNEKKTKEKKAELSH